MPLKEMKVVKEDWRETKRKKVGGWCENFSRRLTVNVLASGVDSYLRYHSNNNEVNLYDG